MNDAATAYIELTVKRPGRQDIVVREPIPRLLAVSSGPLSIYSAMSETMDRLHYRAAEAVDADRRNGFSFLRFEEGNG